MGRFGAVAFQRTEQRITFFHRKGEMVDGTAFIVPAIFAVVAIGVDGVTPPCPSCPVSLFVWLMPVLSFNWGKNSSFS